MAALMLGAALTLAGCGKKDQEAATSQVAANANPDANAAQEVPPAAALDYWKLALARVAGSYGGQCVSPAEQKPLPGPVTIGADGKASGAALTGELAGHEFFLGRIADGSKLAGYTVSAKGGNLEMLIQPTPEQPGKLTASLIQGEAAISCTGPASALALDGQRLYSVFAHLLDSPAKTISCTELLGTPANVAYGLKDGVVTLGQHSIDLSRAIAETAAVADSSREFGYMARLGPEQELHIVLDRTGKLRMVMLRLEKGLLQCEQSER